MPLAQRLHLLVMVGFVVSPISLSAHPLTFTDATIVLHPDATFEVDLIVDLDALALGAPQTADDAALVATLRALSARELDERIDRLRMLFQRRVRLRFDGDPVPFEVSFPDRSTPAATESEIPTLLGLTARLTGAVPLGATSLEFFASRAFSAVHLTIHDLAREITLRSILERGARSDPFTLTAQAELPTVLSIGRQYLYLGFIHIIPHGLDHILFVSGLFLLASHLSALVWQVTIFTVAHAITLSLAVFDVVSLPPQIVESLIAFSIVYVAVENVLISRLNFWRQAVVFGFGLLHGLGFAELLRGLGLPEHERLIGLVSFNLGIELGQLLVIGLLLAAIGWFRHRPWYRSRVTVPVSLVIAGIGLSLLAEHLFKG